jgi:hypothetical protein
MSDRNAVKWVVLGFVALAILGLAGWIGFALILGAFWAAEPRGMPAAPPLEPLSHAELLEFPGDWQPPSFPPQVAIWTHLGHDEKSQIPELNLDLEGLHCRYKGGTAHVDVYVFATSAFEATDMFDRAQTFLLRSGSAVHYPVSQSTDRGLGSRLPSPARAITMWWSQGWLFVFIADDPSLDLETFHIPYLLAIQGGAAAPVESPAQVR